MYLSYKLARDAQTQEVFHTGWLPPMVDFRDYTPETESIIDMGKKLKLPSGKAMKALPTKVDLRQWCSAIEDQKGLASYCV